MDYRKFKGKPPRYFILTANGSQLWFNTKKNLKKFLSVDRIGDQDFAVYKIWKGDI